MSLSPSIEKRLLTLRRKGLTKSAIARRLGIHRNTVSRYTDKADEAENTEEALEVAGIPTNYITVLGNLLRQRSCPACHEPIPILACMSEIRCIHCRHCFRL